MSRTLSAKGFDSPRNSHAPGHVTTILPERAEHRRRPTSGRCHHARACWSVQVNLTINGWAGGASDERKKPTDDPIGPMSEALGQSADDETARAYTGPRR